MGHNQEIAFLARETGWSLEYIGKLKYSKFITLVEELSNLKRVEEYNRDRVTALLLTCWAKEGTTLEDIIGPPPGGSIKEGIDVWQLAEKAGIRIPSKRA